MLSGIKYLSHYIISFHSHCNIGKLFQNNCFNKCLPVLVASNNNKSLSQLSCPVMDIRNLKCFHSFFSYPVFH